jgi:hypothetical protein
MSFYCHYNPQLNEIAKISSQCEADNATFIVFEIQPDIALSLLSGKTNPFQWFAQRNKTFGWELIKKEYENNAQVNRVDNSYLFCVTEGVLLEETDLHVVFDNKNKFVDVYVKIASLNTHEKQIELYITYENDPSFLIQSYFIKLEELRNSITQFDTTGLFHCRRRFSRNEKFENFSLFTTRIFPNITMEIINDNP